MTETTPQSAPVNSGRLKYADPRDLPSFPSTGLRPDGAAASAAATLGWNNQKPVELWKPDKLSSASAAAVLAHDYKMASSWSPSADSAGHQAALLAVGSASSALKHHASTGSKSQHEGWGNSAANQAFHASRPSSLRADDLAHGNTAATQAFNTNRSQPVRKGHAPSSSHQEDRSLAAAKGAMASSRPRATSTPASSRPDSQLQSQAAANALNGAAIAHRASMQPKTSLEDSGAVPVTTMTRNMFTSHPMVKPETDEQQNDERLHQSAVEMAKKMYNQQQRMVEQAKERGEDPDKAYQSPYLNLQDAAYKQAQDRLSKLHDEHQQSREMQEYYGQAQTPKRRFSVANKLRRKYSDEGLFDDREESERIRQQMSMFSNKLSEVDKTKRQHDRDALLAAAQRNVKNRLYGMDEKVQTNTGRVNSTLLSDWEAKAHQAAQTRHDTRSENKGKLDIGGGMLMDQEQIDAIAAKRMQPILDDINEKAEKERERLAALKMEDEEKKRDLEREKERERDSKALNKRIKEEDRQEARIKRQQEKEDERARKEQEKAEKAEQKRLEREGKRKSKHDSAASGFVADDGPEDEHGHETGTTPARDEAAQRGQSPDVAGADDSSPGVASGAVPATDQAPAAEPSAAADAGEADAGQQQVAEGSTSHGSRVKGWIKNRLSRGKSFVEQGQKNEKAEEPEKTEKSEKRKGIFRTSTILRKNKQRNASQASLERRSSSMRDVALAGKSGEQETRDEAEGAAGTGTRRDSRGVSPVSSAHDEAETRSRKDRNSRLDVLPPRPIDDPAPRPSVSPNRETRFREEMDRW